MIVESRTNVLFLEFTSQVALRSFKDQHTITDSRAESATQLTLTKVVFPVPPSPTGLINNLCVAKYTETFRIPMAEMIKRRR